MTTKSYPAKAPTVPKLAAIAVTGADRVPDMLYGLDEQGRVWCRVMEAEGTWRRVPEAADPRDR